jgi:hypothetical protein
LKRVPASAIRRRAGCWKSAASQWTGVGLYRIRAINSSAPLDRFRLDRRLWASLKAWGRAKAMT